MASIPMQRLGLAVTATTQRPTVELYPVSEMVLNSTTTKTMKTKSLTSMKYP